jgi:hypothetical protein
MEENNNSAAERIITSSSLIDPEDPSGVVGTAHW